MAACLHCGEIGAPGALFCTKCGYTLPQGDATPTPTPAPTAPRAVAATPVPPPPPGYPVVLAAIPYIAPANAVPGAMGPIPPPPNAKYCTRCATVIAQPAVYCPVCQQPQP
jgi:RNA polymerase subunit RPABC4/transcription elongation factor Spt4